MSKLVLGVNMFDLDFASKLIVSNNPSNAAPWVLDTCLIMTLLLLIIILITAHLQRCTTEIRLQKMLCLWWRSPHLSIDQHLRFPYFLRIEFLGKDAWDPPDVDFEFSRPPAKSESWNNPNRQMMSCITNVTRLSVVICVCRVLPCRKTTRWFLCEVSPTLVIFNCPSRNSWFEYYSVLL